MSLKTRLLQCDEPILGLGNVCEFLNPSKKQVKLGDACKDIFFGTYKLFLRNREKMLHQCPESKLYGYLNTAQKMQSDLIRGSYKQG